MGLEVVPTKLPMVQVYDFIVAGSTDRFGLGEKMLPAHKIVSCRETSVLIFVISMSNDVESPQGEM